MKKVNNMMKYAIANARQAAVLMSTEAFPHEISDEKIEHDEYGIWLTLDVKSTNAKEGSYLSYVDRGHWFIRITRRGKTTIHSGPHWASKGTYGMHAAKDGYFF